MKKETLRRLDDQQLDLVAGGTFGTGSLIVGDGLIGGNYVGSVSYTRSWTCTTSGYCP